MGQGDEPCPGDLGSRSRTISPETGTWGKPTHPVGSSGPSGGTADSRGHAEPVGVAPGSCPPGHCWRRQGALREGTRPQGCCTGGGPAGSPGAGGAVGGCGGPAPAQTSAGCTPILPVMPTPAQPQLRQPSSGVHLLSTTLGSCGAAVWTQAVPGLPLSLGCLQGVPTLRQAPALLVKFRVPTSHATGLRPINREVPLARTTSNFSRGALTGGSTGPGDFIPTRVQSGARPSRLLPPSSLRAAAAA